MVVFAGTNEGRKLCEFMTVRGAYVTAVVATEYGSLVMPNMPNLIIKEGRLSLAEITDLIDNYDYVVDATHPYANIISDNIKTAIEKRNKKYLRVIRPLLEYENVREFPDICEVCKYLNSTTGNVLVTTGSKELLPYTTIENYRQRLFLRVLPTIKAVNECNNLNFNVSNIICMQGPFSENMNKAMIEQVTAKFLVTKETGKSGGFLEKLSAAKKLGVKVLLVGRPYKEEGLDLEGAYLFLKKELGLKEKKLSYFPIFLDIKKKKIVVIGGGKIATRRIESLLKFDVDILVVAPKLSKTLEVLHKQKKLIIKKREYESRDLDNVFMILVATNCREINEQIYKEAKSRSILVNISDNKEQCDFFFPAIFYDDDVVGGLISKEGNNHKNVKEKACIIRYILKKGDKKNANSESGQQG
ncbi:MAG: precorrin-6A reductase [Clostridiales bacterium]